MKQYNYADIAKYYDELEDNEDVKELNNFLHSFFSRHKISDVLDMTCGTGLQSIFLHKKGYNITAADINTEMLEIVRNKYPKMQYHQANMIDVGFDRKFDAIISSFNAIGHLSVEEFVSTVKNAYNNLLEGGFYIFDIFNFEFIATNFISYEFIDVCKEVDGTRIVRFNDNKLDRDKKIMGINQKTYIQEELERIQEFNHSWDLQIYSTDDLKHILNHNGLEVVDFLTIEGKEFDVRDSLFILTIAKKTSQKN